MAGMAALGFGTAVGLGLRSAGRAAAEFESTTTRMVSLVGVARDEVDQMSAAALRMGDTGRGPQELGDALFFATSAGLEGAQALDVVDQAARSASVGLGDTATITDLLTSVQNSYGAETLSAAEANDVLVGTIRAGKAEAPELAGALGGILPIASAMDVSFADVGAALASMTRTGTGAAEASTQLQAILSGLMRPTGASAEALASLGLSAADLRETIQEDGLWAAMMQLRDATGDNVEVIGEVIPNVRALRGFLDLTGANAAETAVIFEEMADSTGLAGDAFAEWSTTTEAAQARFSAAMEALKISLGQEVLPLMAGFAERGEAVVSRLNEMDPAARSTAVGLATAGSALGIVGGAALLALPRIASTQQAMAGLGVNMRSIGRFAVGPWGIATGAVVAGFAAWTASAERAASMSREAGAAIGQSGGDADAALRIVSDRFVEVSRSSGFLADAGAMLRQMFTGEVTLAADRATILEEVVRSLAATSPQAAYELLQLAEAEGLVRREADGAIVVIDSMGEAIALTGDDVRELTGHHGDLARALEDTDYAATHLTPSLGGYTAGAGEAANATDELLGELGALPDGLDDAAGATVELTETQAALGKAITSLRCYPIDDEDQETA